MTGLATAPADLWHKTAHTFGLMRDATRMFRRLASRYGDPFMLPTLDETYVVTGDPTHVAAIFAADPDVMDPPSGVVEPLLGTETVVLARGARHRRKRRVLAPPLHGPRMKAWAGVIATAARGAFADVRAGETVALLARTQRLSLDVIVRAIFGMRDPARIDRFHAAVGAVIAGLPAWLLFAPWLHRSMAGVGPWDRYRRAERALLDLLREEIARARATPDGERDDVLALLLSARDEDGAPLPDGELLDELRTLVIAGHETTATTLAWALWLLHRNPAPLARLRDELAPLGATPDPSALAALPYLDAVCDETLRLAPIVPIMARRLARDWTLAGRVIPRGTMVCPAVMLTHFDPAVYPDPTRFEPARFLERRYTPGEFYPFGGGARRCLGASMAGYELKLALGTVLAAHRFEDAGDGPIGNVMNGITTRPSKPLRLVASA
ncbi:MAG: cytochrome P450 [Polyangiales bacterium]